MPFLENFEDIQNQLTDKLDENDIREGSDVVVCTYAVCMHGCMVFYTDNMHAFYTCCLVM